MMRTRTPGPIRQHRLAFLMFGGLLILFALI
jgi:hypothetical protein